MPFRSLADRVLRSNVPTLSRCADASEPACFGWKGQPLSVTTVAITRRYGIESARLPSPLRLSDGRPGACVRGQAMSKIDFNPARWHNRVILVRCLHSSTIARLFLNREALAQSRCYLPVTAPRSIYGDADAVLLGCLYGSGETL